MMDDVDPDSPIAATVSDARLVSVLDTAVDGIVVIDDQARILVFNKACERLFGIKAAEAIGRNVRILMPPEYSERHDGFIGNYLRTGERKIIGIGREVQGLRADGTVFPLELSVGEAMTPDGRQFIGILRDLSSRHDVERRLAGMQADLLHMARVSAIDEMGAALAHELNQPLTAIMLYLQLVVRGQATPEDAPKVLDKAVKEAERAGNIIRRMRRFVEKRDPERRQIDLDALVDEAIELALFGRRHLVTVERRRASAPTLVEADPVQVQQIMVNLVRNALEAVQGSDEATIIVTTRCEETNAVVAVEDSGPGIPEAHLPEIFKAFSSTKSKGLGLGLAISRSIAQNHGGDLSVEPGGNGRGATFELRLPMLRFDTTL